MKLLLQCAFCGYILQLPGTMSISLLVLIVAASLLHQYPAKGMTWYKMHLNSCLLNAICMLLTGEMAASCLHKSQMHYKCLPCRHTFTGTVTCNPACEPGCYCPSGKVFISEENKQCVKPESCPTFG